MNITVSIVDCVYGRPAEGVDVHLERKAGVGWEATGTQRTDREGRIHDWRLPQDVLPGGVYRLVCEVDRYFATTGVTPFHPRITAEFRVFGSEKDSHLHIGVAPHAYQVCQMVG